MIHNCCVMCIFMCICVVDVDGDDDDDDDDADDDGDGDGLPEDGLTNTETCRK